MLAYARVATYIIDANTPALGAGIRSVFDSVFDHVGNKISKVTDAVELRKDIEQFLENRCLNIIVTIDEVDRLSNHEIREVCRLIRAVGDIGRISYLVCYDKDRVAEALGAGVTSDQKEKISYGKHYIEKIFHLNIELPIPLLEEYRAILVDEIDGLRTRNLFKTYGEADETRLTELCDIICQAVEHPREITRLISNYTIISQMVEGEAHDIDTLAYCILSNKFPEHLKPIRKNADYYVLNPIGAPWLGIYSLDTNWRQKYVEEMHKKKDDFDQARPILSWAFPKMFSNTSNARIDRTTIEYRSPLLSLMRLGLLPQRRSISEMRLGISDPKLRPAFLLQAFKGRIGDEIDQILDFVLKSKTPDLVTLWTDIFESLETLQIELDEKSYQLGGLIDAIEITFSSDKRLNVYLASKILKQNGKKCVSLTAKIIRRHIFAHSLFGNTQSYPEEKIVLDLKETEKLANWYATDLVMKNELASIINYASNSEVLWLLLDVLGVNQDKTKSLIDSGIKSLIDSAVPDEEHFFRFARLLYGYKYSTALAITLKFMDLANINKWVAKLENLKTLTTNQKEVLEALKEKLPSTDG